MDKLIMVLLDACQYEAGSRNLGFLEHLTDYHKAAKYKVKGEIPSLSKSMYGTMFTGLPVYAHGATCNEIPTYLQMDSVFSLCRKAGGDTAAAAWCWMSELFNGQPFNKLTDRIQISNPGGIAHGIYYWQDEYPDEIVYADGEHLRLQYAPDFLLIHPMGIDNWGHLKGAESAEYEGAIAYNSSMIAFLMPLWLEAGYQVLVTADHGMNRLGLHGGTDDAQRMTPLYIISPKVETGRFDDHEISQLGLAGTLCRLLGIPKGAQMPSPDEIRWKV